MSASLSMFVCVCVCVRERDRDTCDKWEFKCHLRSEQKNLNEC